MIGKLKRVPLREVWKHEALDFTTWMQDNLDVINDVLDLNLANAEREKSAGTFSVDLVAEDDRGNAVIIENQLGRSDHDHLGKVLTYLTSMEAKIAIWIVADPRPEHVRAISWLNESSSASFYLLKVEAIQIGESPPAPLLTLIVGPSEESRQIGETKKELSERDGLRLKFWTQLLDYAKTITKLHANITPNIYHWVGTSSGINGLSYNYTIAKEYSVVELYIDRGKDSDEENKAIFDKLYQSKDEIERQFGANLIWQKLEGKKACRIKRELQGGYRTPENKWPSLHDNMVQTMVRLEKALAPHIKRLKN